MPPAKTLRLLHGADPSRDPSGSLLGAAPTPDPLLTARPADRVELHEFGCSAGLASIRAAAARRRLSPDTALRITIERVLLLDELREGGLEQHVCQLDRRGAEARATIELCSASSAYLRHLMGFTTSDRAEWPVDSPRCAVPMRLSDRLLHRSLEAPEDPDAALENAIEWEIAAVLSGRSMSEWAYMTAALEMLGPRD